MTILVPDYDDAINISQDLGFELVEDTPQGGKRWVVVRPAADAETGIVLAQATTAETRRSGTNSAAGRLFLHTDDFRDHARAAAAGVHFREAPDTSHTAPSPCSTTSTATAGTSSSPPSSPR